ncbi:MAG: hypothetical protein ACREJQ_05305, partial [bacterium]
MVTLLAQVTEAGPSAAGIVEGARIMFSNLPTIILFTPLLGMLILAMFPSSRVREIRNFTLAMTCIVAIEIVVLMVQFRQFPMQHFIVKLSWFSTIGASYFVGVDGISLALLLLTGIVFVSAALGSWSIKDRVKEYSILFLLLECSIIGVFIALDYFLFFIAWELMLVPMYFLIGI